MRKKTDVPRKTVSVVVLIVGIAMFLFGTGRLHLIYEEAANVEAFEGFGLSAEEIKKLSEDKSFLIDERQLVIDSTFSGVKRKNGKLYSNYDRSKPLGKQKCPT